MKVPNEISIDDDIKSALQAAFEATWARASLSVSIAQPCLQDEGIEYQVELDDPFSGSMGGRYFITWKEISISITDPKNIRSLEYDVEIFLAEEGENYGGGELVEDADGRVHFASDLE